MRSRFDQLGKRIGVSALSPSGVTVAQDEIHPDARHADLRHEPDPAKEVERERLGLLGRLASVPCLIELYNHPPAAAELRACLGKHIAVWEKRARRARRKPPPEEPLVDPFLWIVAGGRPVKVLAALRGTERPGWPRGVYFCGEEVLRVGVVVTPELPRERSTLLVRMMAPGRLLQPTLADLRALPADAHERAVSGQIVLDLRQVLGTKPRRSRAEEEFIVAVDDLWEQARKKGVSEGRKEGRAEEAGRAVLTVLQARGIGVPEAVRERVLGEKDLARLERWVAKAAVAASAAEVVDDPS